MACAADPVPTISTFETLLAAGREPERNPVIRLVKRILPVEESERGKRFLVRIGGRWHAITLAQPPADAARCGSESSKCDARVTAR